MAEVVAATRKGFRSRLGSALRPKKLRNKIREDVRPSIASEGSAEVNDVLPAPLAPLEVHRQHYRDKWQQVDTQLGERRDFTELLHSIGRVDPFDSEQSSQTEESDHGSSGEHIVASLSPELWDLIAGSLTPIEAANLALSCRTLYIRLGRRPWDILDRPENWSQKIEFLIRFDQQLPDHLLCFPCASYHLRTQRGNEALRPAHILNPLFNCPNARNAARPAPKTRITPGRYLHFVFVQLALRAQKFSPRHGISLDTISKRWRRDGWWYHSQYYVHKNHLFMRVVSSCFALAGLTPAGMRLLLYSRDDYWPYFSVCGHWKEGELMQVCKCALSHIPVPRASDGYQGIQARLHDELAGRSYTPTPIITLCGECRPMRRCPECATEYLVEIKLTEDNTVRGRIAFRYAIIVTRWTDLGDGTSPLSPEWAACNREGPPYDSFAALQKRAISGIFESAFAQDAIPGQRIISLNPKSKTLRGQQDSWY